MTVGPGGGAARSLSLHKKDVGYSQVPRQWGHC